MQHAFLGVLTQIIIQIPWYVLVGFILIPYRKVKVRTIVSIVAVSYLLYLGYSFYLFFHDGSVENSAEWLAKLNNAGFLLDIILVAEMFFFFRLHIFKMFYVLLMAVSIATMVSEIGWYLGAFLFPEAMYYGDFYTWQYVLILSGILLLIIPLIWQTSGKKLQDSLEEIPSAQFLAMCAVPVLFTIMVIYFLYMDNYYDFPILYGSTMLVLIGITGISTYGLTLHAIMSGVERTRTEVAIHNIENQLILQADRFEILTQNIAQTRRARHDLRHHLSAVSQLVYKKDYEGIEAYLADYRKSIPEDRIQSICENAIVDAVVWHYVSEAEKEGAVVDLVISLEQDTGIHNTDLCIVFGNIFENAVNGIMRQRDGQRFIRARCKTTNHKIILVVDNSADENRKKGSGIGLGSVRAVAEKYHGTAQFEYINGVYHSSVVLVCPT